MEEKEVDRRIGSRVRALRQGQGLTLRDVAKELGISYVFLGELERGEKPWKVDRLEQVANYFEVSASLLHNSEIPVDRIRLISVLLPKLADLPPQQLEALELFLEAKQG